MVGSMVVDVLSRNRTIELAATSRREAFRADFRLDAAEDLPSQLEPTVARFPADYVLNCIGVINRYCRDSDPLGVRRAVEINARFPHSLADAIGACLPNSRVIHLTTDCVFSGRVGGYDESAIHDPIDFYGKSKSLGEVQTDNWLNIRCSVIGPEIGHRGVSLLEWFLQHPAGSDVPGFTHHRWNGVTTLQFAQFCEDLIVSDRFASLRDRTHTLHFVPNETVSKYELLQIFNQVYERGCTIRAVDGPPPEVDRSLTSIHLPLEARRMRDAVSDLRSYSSRGERIGA
jgi:dTDP-4-dehydrorhamnose reductase